MPARDVGDLDVGDLTSMVLDEGERVFAHPAGMVNVVLKTDVFAVGSIDEVKDRPGSGESKFRNIDTVDWFDRQLHADLVKRRGGEFHVLGEDRESIWLWSELSGKTIDSRRPQHGGIIDGELEPGGKFSAPRRLGGNAAIAGLPIAGRKVEEHEFKCVS